MNYQTLLSAASQAPRYILAAIVGITVILAFTPLLPVMPSAGLDPSWAYAMNEAVALGLSFGREFIFTFGPYAAIYTKVYHPGTDSIAQFGGFLIGICSAVLLLLLTRGASLLWALIFCLLIITIIYVRDPLFFSYPLLLVLAIYRITLPEGNKYAIHLPKKMEILFSCLLLPLGLLSLIKGSYLIVSVLISALSFAIFWRTERKSLAYYSLAFPFVSAVFFWLVSGQSALDIPHYLINMMQIISGYTDAMAAKGKTLEIVYYIIAATGILYIIATLKNTPNHSKVFLFAATASILFLTFKGAFVRHDIHAIIASTMIIIVATLLKLAVEHRHMNLIIALCFISWFYTDKRHVNTSTAKVYTNIKDFYKNAKYGIKDRQAKNNIILARFDEKNLTIQKDHLIPLLYGTSDIYSYNQSHLIASGNIWSPRPVFQSYSVYTPKLAKINEEHLYSDRSPDNIIFKVEPIDRRLPALEDGASWPAIINNYAPVTTNNGFLIVKKKGSSNTPADLTKIYSGEHQLGSTIVIPDSNSAIFAEIDIERTLVGRLLSFMFKPHELSITLEMHSGQTITYTMISTMAKSGFIISPFIENTNDFILLFYQSLFPNRKYVKSISIFPTDGNSIFWRDTFSVKLSQLDLPDNGNVTELVEFDQITGQAHGYTITATPVQCEGKIDSFNGSPPNIVATNASGILAVRGQLAISFNDNIVPDDIYAVLTDRNGVRKFIKTHIITSPDTNKHSKHPKSTLVHFNFMTDVSSLEGDFQFTIARARTEKLELCEQPEFNFPINLKQTSSKHSEQEY